MAPTSVLLLLWAQYEFQLNKEIPLKPTHARTRLVDVVTSQVQVQVLETQVEQRWDKSIGTLFAKLQSLSEDCGREEVTGSALAVSG
jgi:hypothetical protein